MSKEITVVLEVKNVDRFKGRFWENGLIPNNVLMQCLWHLYIVRAYCEENGFALPNVCHVRALIGGNKKVDRIVEYNADQLENLKLIVDDFIANYVDTGVEPPIDASDSYTAYLAQKYLIPETVLDDWKESKQMVQVDEVPPEILNKLNRFFELKSQVNLIETEMQEIKNHARDIIGDKYGVFCMEGRFIAPMVSGSTSWKTVHEKLYEWLIQGDRLNVRIGEFDKVLDKLIQESKGDSYRKLTPYPKK